LASKKKGRAGVSSIEPGRGGEKRGNYHKLFPPGEGKGKRRG